MSKKIKGRNDATRHDAESGGSKQRGGYSLAFVGGLFFMIGIFGFAIPGVSLDDGGWLFSVLSVLGIVLFFWGRLVRNEGLGYSNRAKASTYFQDDRPATQVETQNTGPYVVYLRSFDQDTTQNNMWHGIYTGLTNIPKDHGSELQLARAVAPVGKLIAIGHPKESLPSSGALRVYPEDDEWQEVISDWLPKASLVILRAGATNGLFTEVELTLKTISPEKVLILMLNLKPTVYKSFAKRVWDASSGIELPDFNQVSKGRQVSGFFEFGKDGKPRFLPLSAPYWSTSGYYPLQSLFSHTLRPVFERLGVRQRWRSPISPTKILLLLLPVVWVFVVLMFFAMASISL